MILFNFIQYLAEQAGVEEEDEADMPEGDYTIQVRLFSTLSLKKL